MIILPVLVSAIHTANSTFSQSMFAWNVSLHLFAFKLSLPIPSGFHGAALAQLVRAAGSSQHHKHRTVAFLQKTQLLPLSQNIHFILINVNFE